VTVRLMSDRELRRLEVVQDLDRRRLTTAAAGQLSREPERRSDRAPRRRDQHNARLFKVG
jgi:hypothetical protein